MSENFKSLFVLGPQRTGTTWIYNQLCLQPSGVYVDRVIKESNIFLESMDAEWHRDILYSNTTGIGSPALMADVCSVYAGVPNTVERILNVFPEANFVWINRARSSRLQSLDIHHRVNAHGKRALGFTLSKELGCMQSDLNAWSDQLQSICPGRTLVLDFNDLRNHPETWIQQISDFVNVNLTYFDTGVINGSRGELSGAKRIFLGKIRPIQRLKIVEKIRRFKYKCINSSHISLRQATAN